MHKTENKSLWRDEMNYGSDTWYMGRTYGELKKLRLRLANFRLHN